MNPKTISLHKSPGRRVQAELYPSGTVRLIEEKGIARIGYARHRWEWHSIDLTPEEFQKLVKATERK